MSKPDLPRPTPIADGGLRCHAPARLKWAKGAQGAPRGPCGAFSGADSGSGGATTALATSWVGCESTRLREGGAKLLSPGPLTPGGRAHEGLGRGGGPRPLVGIAAAASNAALPHSGQRVGSVPVSRVKRPPGALVRAATDPQGRTDMNGRFSEGAVDLANKRSIRRTSGYGRARPRRRSPRTASGSRRTCGR